MFFFLFVIVNFLRGDSGSYPKISEIDSGRYQFGDILIDKKKRQFALPAICNQTSGLIEYALVHENGKTHESLFRTKVSPKLIHATFLLLKENPNPDFFTLLENNRNLSKINSLQILVEWEDNSSWVKEDLNAMVRNEAVSRQLSENSFIFTGSRVIEGNYLAELDGSIVAVYHDNRATINSRDEHSSSDDLWIANHEKMPPKDFPVTIRFQLPTND